MATTLGSKAVGSSINIKVNGTTYEFLVVHQGKPGSNYDDSCNGTWLMMKDLYESRQWHSSDSNSYSASTIHTYLNGTFLNLIDETVRNQIVQIKIPYRAGTGYGTSVTTGGSGLSTKVFLLSATEVGFSGTSYQPTNEGATLSYFSGTSATSSDSKRIAYLNGTAASWWLRSPYCYSSGGSGLALFVYTGGGWDYGFCSGALGVRPAFTLPSTLLVSDDGSITTNTAPSAPPSISVPSSIMGGSTITVSWSAATDTDGNLSGYILQRSTDGGTNWTQVYKGSALTYTDSITKGWTSVMYRVKAYDSYDAESSYTTSTARTVDNNSAPTITSTSSGDLGTKTAGFSVSYSVNDEDTDDTVTVTETLDSTTKRTYTATKNATNSFAVTGDYFQKVLNGSHTMTISATDGKATTTKSLTFTKSVTKAVISMTTPMDADAQITICSITVGGSIPADATFTVEVTNNGKDTSPVWEDCTAEARNGRNYLFTNATAANGFAFNFRVTAERGASGTGGYITSIQGGFQ